MSKEKSIVVIGGLPSSLINFRGDFLKALIADGWKVTAMAGGARPEDKAAVEALGATYIDYPLQRTGLNIFADLKTFLALRRTLSDLRPDALFCYTIKPVIWGGLASRFAGKPKFFALITGLGFTFQKGGALKNFLTRIISQLYRLSLNGAKAVIFQNDDNRKVFEDRKLVALNKSRKVNGSGVNIERYKFTPLDKEQTTFLLIARLLYDKGIREYAEAAKIVKAKHPEAQIQILGPTDPSPNGFPLPKLEALHESGTLEYLGSTDDVRPFVEACQIYVLPSYHEGLPRTVIEAMSIGRPVIATDIPGCRDTVIVGETGVLVPVKDAQALADAMIEMIENRENWVEMGSAGRKLAENKFDVNAINADLLSIISEA